MYHHYSCKDTKLRPSLGVHGFKAGRGLNHRHLFHTWDTLTNKTRYLTPRFDGLYFYNSLFTLYPYILDLVGSMR